ncbi:hypothetical protein TcBrA4_0041520 [Trypanosoma cruzi]|nr:hypothetical protein TcBrA4_0041520 [Trypanosoma cruzi]
MNLPPSDPPSENTKRGSDTAMAILLGSIFFLALFFMILCIVWSVFWRRRRMAATESRRRRHYPEVEAVPQNVTGGDVEGALLVGEDNRSILENASVILTRVRSLSSSSLLSATKEEDAGELTVDAVALRGESEEVRVPQSGEGGNNLLPQPSQPRTFRLPKEIYDTSTNSVRKLYVRRPSAAVYGSSVYVSKNNSVEPTSNCCGRPQELAVSKEEEKKE